MDLMNSAFYTLKNTVQNDIPSRLWHMSYIHNNLFYVIGGWVQSQQRRDVHCIDLRLIFEKLNMSQSTQYNDDDIDEAL